MKIEDIVPKDATSNDQVINELKKRSGKAPDIEKIRKSLDPKLHKINSTIERPDRPIYAMVEQKDLTAGPYNPAPRPPGGAGALPPKVVKQFERMEKVNRIALALQKLIVKRAVSFSVGNPIIRTYTGDTVKDYEEVIKGLERVLKDNHETSLNKHVASAIFSATEVAEYWYTTDSSKDLNGAPRNHTKYGFPTRKKLKCIVFNPLNGVKLYPIFDIYGDFIAFSREFSAKTENNSTDYFETFTDEEIILFKRVNGGNWEKEPARKIVIGKMPIIYGTQDFTEFEDVDEIINRLELLLSNFAEINDYNAAPKHFVKGKIASWGQKGAANTIIQGDKDTEYKVVSWDHAPESVKNEIETLLKFIFTLTQTPDISFDNLKSLGTISGVALKLLFMDAHLKVKDKEGVLIEYLERRYRVILAYLGYLADDDKSDLYDDLDIDVALDPFMIADDKEQAEITMILNGDQPVKSQETTVKEWGGDDSEIAKIKAEDQVRRTALVTEPTGI